MMWRKISSSALTLSLALGVFATVSEAEEVDAEVTRGEYVKSLIEALDVELGTGASVKFKDVPDSLKPYIEKAIELKLITGKSETVFAPNEKLSRVHAFLILARGLQDDKTYSPDVLTKFTDYNQILPSYREQLAKMVTLGVLNGYTDQTLKPANIVTKTQMDNLLQRFLQEYKPGTSNTTVSLRILSTTDIHTNIVNYDYYKDIPSNSLGLVKVSTLIQNARAEQPNTILLDNGDSIQGTPLGSYKSSVKKLVDGEVHPSIAAMNYLDYDAAIYGNHEFNYGLEFLDEVTDDAAFPYVNANIIDSQTKELKYTPYVMIDKEVVDSNGNTTTLKIGVTGIVPPQILKWDKSHLEGKLEVKDSVQVVEEIVPILKKEGADVVIVLSHSGMGDATHEIGEEDVSYLLTKVADVDAVITGHAHQVFPGTIDASLTNVNQEQGTMNNVPVVMPGKYGSHLGVIDLELEQDGTTWDVKQGTGAVREIAKDDSDVDAELVEIVKEAHEGTLQYVREAVGTTTADIHSYFAQVQDDPSIQIVTIAQKAYVEQKIKGTANEDLPVLSAGAPFKAGTRSDPEYYTFVPKGELAIKNVADLYLYDNTVAVLKITGADVKEWLEMSAGQFNQIDPSKTEEQQLINTEFRSYNYDVIDGVTYEIDVTQPAKYDPSGKLVNENASRIVNLQYDGKPIDDKQQFIVATNNYRANGTFPGVRNATQVEIYPDENRQAIIDYILEQKTINPSADNNWTFAPFPVGVNVVFESSKNAVQVLSDDSNIQYVGEGTDGFGKYTIK